METKKFKCKDEVIYRFKGGAGHGDPDPWIYGIFSHYKKDGYIVVNGNSHKASLTDILPFEGNEDLVGTDQNPDEEVKLEEGEVCIFFDEIECFEKIKDLIVDKFKLIDRTEEAFWQDGEPNIWKHCIRLKDFDPNNMEETKKKILCVKNGKVVKYKN